MSFDPVLSRWSWLLWFVAFGTLALNLLQLALVWSQPGLTVDLRHGGEPWSIGWTDLSLRIRLALGAVLVLPQLAWLAAVWQVLRLGQSFRKGQVFTEVNIVRFQAIGLALVLQGVLTMAVLPAVAAILWVAGVTPWFADMGGVFSVDFDYLLAGLLFYVIGRIMRRALELDAADRLTI